MKRILIVYPNMFVGGSTTSLLGLLSVIDYEIYDVNLLLYKNKGPLINAIPHQVKLLNQACKYNSVAMERIYKFIHPRTLLSKINSRKIAKKSGKFPLVESQIMCYENARLSKRVEKEYDCAIAFLEGWPSIYVANSVCAKKKICWIHVDYSEAGFDPQYDKEMYNKFDHMITVSEKCLENLKCAFPGFADKMLYIGNISDVNDILRKSTQAIDFSVSHDSINLITVCRLSMRHKGLDRMLDFLEKQKRSYSSRIVWYVIGDGPDKEKFVQMVHSKGLDKDVVILGEKKNPFPYIKVMDAFVLLSRYEGKPMVITEAQILEIPVIVAEYASAKEQISHEENGIILPNDDGLIVDAMLKVVNREKIGQLKLNIQKNVNTFHDEKDKIKNLLKEESL